MAIFVIHAYDNENHGAYEMEEWTLYEGTINDAVEQAKEMSYNVITSYQTIYEELMERAMDYARKDEDIISYEQYLARRDHYYDQLLEEAIGYTITELCNTFDKKEYESMIKNGNYTHRDLVEMFGEGEY